MEKENNELIMSSIQVENDVRTGGGGVEKDVRTGGGVVGCGENDEGGHQESGEGEEEEEEKSECEGGWVHGAGENLYRVEKNGEINHKEYDLEEGGEPDRKAAGGGDDASAEFAQLWAGVSRPCCLRSPSSPPSWLNPSLYHQGLAFFYRFFIL